MYVVNISHFISHLFAVLNCHHIMTELVYLQQGDRGPNGASGPPGDIGIGFPGAKVTLLYQHYLKNILCCHILFLKSKLIQTHTMYNYLIILYTVLVYTAIDGIILLSYTILCWLSCFKSHHYVTFLETVLHCTTVCILLALSYLITPLIGVKEHFKTSPAAGKIVWWENFFNKVVFSDSEKLTNP